MDWKEVFDWRVMLVLLAYHVVLLGGGALLFKWFHRKREAAVRRYELKRGIEPSVPWPTDPKAGWLRR